MLRLYILSLTCFLIFKAKGLKAQDQQEIISANKDAPSSVDEVCQGALGTKESFNEVLRIDLSEALRRMDLPLFPEVGDFEAFAIRALWNEIPVVRGVLQDFAREIGFMQGLSDLDGDDYSYKEELKKSILRFIQALSKKVVGKDRLIQMMTDNSLHLSEDQINILTEKMRQLEPLIHQLETTSPVEDFIYTDIINSATEHLQRSNSIRTFDLEEYVTRGLNLSNFNFSLPGQKRHLFQQYQLLQRYGFPETVGSNPVRVEQEMRDQGYSEDVIRGLDHARDSLRLAQSLRSRSIDPVSTHIPEFAELIDEHIAYIRKSIIESQKFSSSEKTERLELLDALESKAQAYKAAEELTYFRWLHLNLGFSMVATPVSDLLSNDKHLYSFMFNHESIDFESFKKWVINDDGSDLLKVADIFKIYELRGYENFDDYGNPNYNDENEGAINDIIERLGLNLNLNDLDALYSETLNSGESFITKLARQLNINLYNFSFEGNNSLVNFVYLFNRFPKRIMIPTIHDLGFMAITRTHNRGVHLLGLNDSASFNFHVHDIEHSALLKFISDLEIVNHFENQLESLPRSFQELIEEVYLDFTHEMGETIMTQVTLKESEGIVDPPSAIETDKRIQEQILFQYVSRLGRLTESEELEMKKAILILHYLSIISNYPMYRLVVEEGEDIEFTEESVTSGDTFVLLRFIPRLYSLYEQEQRLLDTLDNSN